MIMHSVRLPRGAGPSVAVALGPVRLAGTADRATAQRLPPLFSGIAGPRVRRTFRLAPGEPTT
jgi:hypothetical protein